MPDVPIKQVYPYHDPTKSNPGDVYKFCPRCKNKLVMIDRGHHDRLGCNKCGFVYYRNPVATVSVLIVEGEHIVLGKRIHEPRSGKWAVPSGFIEYEDDFLTAAILETKEETGLDVEILAILNVVTSFMEEGHYLNIDLLAQPVGGELHAGDDMEIVDWFDPNESLPEMAFQEDIDLIRLYLSKESPRLPVDPKYAWRELEK